MTKVIASRIKNVLPDIIHPNQTGYVKDRFIGETIRSIYDVMDFTVKENVPGLMLFIDFQKAFDSVEWEYLFKCLEAFNFGPDFLHRVKVFYKNIQSCILNNGMTSSFFTLERGVRQEDPLSQSCILNNGMTSSFFTLERGVRQGDPLSQLQLHLKNN